MVWQPLNLTAVCPVNSTLQACSPFGFVYLNLLVQLFSNSLDDGYQEPSNNGEEYDFIVVGAGSAGCVVANRLSENPEWKVLLLEAGPEQPEVTRAPGLLSAVFNSNLDWNYSTEPNGNSCLASGGRCSWISGKMMGGSSSINGIAYIRGNKADYDGWAALGNEGWSYEDVLPFFKKSEKNMNIKDLDTKYHGVTGEQYVSSYSYVDKPSLMVTEAFHEKGLPLTDFNGAHQDGTAQAQATAFAGQRVSANSAFIRPIRYTRKNLTIKTDSEALQILIDENKKAYGIIYSQNGNQITAYAKKEVIVSAGALHSPQLLMLSGIGPKDHLEKIQIPVVQDLAVGENLHDHVSLAGVVIAMSNKTATTVSEDEMLDAVQDYAEAKIKSGPISATGAYSSMAFIRTEPNLTAPDIHYHIGPLYNVNEYIDDMSGAGRLQLFPASFYNGLLPKTMNVVPKSRGVLLLNESDPNSTPIIYPNIFGDESDLIPLLKGTRFLLSLEDTEAFRSNGAYFVRKSLPPCQDYEWGTDEYYICLAKSYTASTFHYAGTCKMGPKSDEKAVVDNELRVYGVSALRVIDASIMPVVVRGNTNAPTIMIGEKGVDFIIKYWQKNSEAYLPSK